MKVTNVRISVSSVVERQRIGAKLSRLVKSNASTERGGNPNLLWGVRSDALTVIDHNQAFDPDFDAARFLESHVFVGYWNRVFSDHLERRKYQERMAAVLSGLAACRLSKRPKPAPHLHSHPPSGVPTCVAAWLQLPARARTHRVDGASDVPTRLAVKRDTAARRVAAFHPHLVAG